MTEFVHKTMLQQALQQRKWLLTLLLLLSCLIPIGLVLTLMQLTNTGFPRDDDLLSVAPIAIHVADGTFEPATLLERYNFSNHFLVTATSITALSAWACDYCEPLYADTTVVFALVIWGLLGFIFYRFQRENWLILFALSAWFIFTVQQGWRYNADGPYLSIWASLAYAIRVHSVLYFLIGLGILLRSKSLIALMIVMLMGVMASFSSAPGLAVWPVYLFVILWQDDARKWRKLGLVLLVGCITVIPYMFGNVDSVAVERINLNNVPGFTMAIMGNLPVRLVADNTILLSTIVGIVALIVAVLLVFLLYRENRQKDLIVPLAFMLFAFIGVLMTAVGRSGWSFEQIFPGTYLMPTALFWVALIMLAFSVLSTRLGASQILHWLVYGSIGALFLANAMSMFRLMTSVEPRNRDVLIDCAQQYSIMPDVQCSTMFAAPSPQILKRMDELVSHRLSIFRDIPFYAVPDAMSNDAAVILSRPYEEYNNALRNNYLINVPDEHIYTYASRESETPDSMPESFVSALTASGQVWWLFDDPALHTAIELPVFDDAVYRQIHLTPVIEGLSLQIAGFELMENPPEAQETFGDELVWRGGTVDYESDVLSVHTEWSRARDVTLDYSLSVQVRDEFGNGIPMVPNVDHGFPMPTSSWQPDHIYTDTTSISLPDDLPSGQYQVGVVIYYYLNPDEPLQRQNDNARTFLPIETVSIP